MISSTPYTAPAPLTVTHGWYQVTEQIPRWNHVNGLVNPGLTARREAEVELFNL